MTLLYYDPVFLEHNTGDHPERPQRLISIIRRLDEGLLANCRRPGWDRVTLERIGRVHSLDYAKELEKYCAGGGGQIESDTVCCPKSFEAAVQATSAVCDAVERVVKGEDNRALALVRPPGHHALEKAPMGFCLFNNVAIGARVAIKELALERVLIVDWDVHHGNGTQATFYEDPQVGFFSIHRWPFYPGTGDADETGAGPGLGSTLNLPIEFGTARSAYLSAFRSGLERIAAMMRPQLILISAGFDAHREDPVGSLQLEVEDFAALTDAILDVATVHSGGRVVSVLEGGYNPPILAESVALHLRRLQDYKPRTAQPPA
jgi:acetoin utilization deacetylase AcuC-like enzyme